MNPAQPPVPPGTTRGGTANRWLVGISLAAGIGFTASAEYHLARTIGAAVPVAVLLPLALDVYVVAAVRRGRGIDIALSLTLMGVAQVAAHMLEAGVVSVGVKLVAAVSLLVPLSIWRVHALARERPVPPVPVPAPDHGPAALPRLVPVPVEVPIVPELEAVPLPVARPVPALPAAAKPKRKRVTAKVARKPRRTGTGTGNGSGGTKFAADVEQARAWLANDPTLTGTDIGTRLGTGESYGRRVKRAAGGTK